MDVNDHRRAWGMALICELYLKPKADDQRGKSVGDNDAISPYSPLNLNKFLGTPLGTLGQRPTAYNDKYSLSGDEQLSKV